MPRNNRNHWVVSEGHILPSSVFEPWDRPKQRPECGICCDTGVTIETIDEERYDVVVACWKCRVYCKACDRYVQKSGHECVPKKEKKS